MKAAIQSAIFKRTIYRKYCYAFSCTIFATLSRFPIIFISEYTKINLWGIRTAQFLLKILIFNDVNSSVKFFGEQQNPGNANFLGVKGASIVLIKKYIIFFALSMHIMFNIVEIKNKTYRTRSK